MKKVKNLNLILTIKLVEDEYYKSSIFFLVIHDILAISNSVVTLELTFRTGGHMLDPFQTSMVKA